MALEEYNRKRNFDKTPEPSASADIENVDKFRFVLQRHQSRNLHYDLRLEIEGTLKSWAIPKGPSLIAGVQRLSVHTEDHPMAYLTFAGDIPKGNYGAGNMQIWDTGTFTLSHENTSEQSISEAYASGKLKIVFQGEFLKGKFSLVKTNDKNWLLLKSKDEYVSDLPIEEWRHDNVSNDKNVFPDFVQPMLAKLQADFFASDEWFYELKYDGYRAIADTRSDELKLYSRNGQDFSKAFPSVFDALEDLPFPVVLDGEIVALDKKGKIDFHLMKDPRAVKIYYVFDVLYLNGFDVRSLPLEERRPFLLQALPEKHAVIKISEFTVGDGTAVFNRAKEQKLEGIIAKKKTSVYVDGKRSSKWLKIKLINQQAFVVGGYTLPQGARSGIGALLLGSFEDEKLSFHGHCGAGLGADVVNQLLQVLEPLECADSPFAEKVKPNNTVKWVSPSLVVQIKFSEITPSGSLRHPVFIAIRNDKDAEEVSFLEPVSEGHSEPSKSKKNKAIHPSISNPNKVYFPDIPLKKHALIEYYQSIHELIIPFLIDRPMSLHRHPEGIEGHSFYQKDINFKLPKGAESIDVYSESADKNVRYIICNTAEALLYINNLGCIELNPWFSTVEDIDSPDMVLLDLDPPDNNSFELVRTIALEVKNICDEVNIASALKTSGKRGVHILMGLNKGAYTYEQSRQFAELLASLVWHRLSDITSMERKPAARKGKVYLDYLQNRRGQTMAAPLSVRPVPGAQISMPISWDMLKEGITPQDFNIFTARETIHQQQQMYIKILKQTLDIQKVLNNIIPLLET